MKTLTAIAYLVISPLAALSQAPSGHFNYAFTNTPLWDFSGAYTNSLQGDTVTVQLEHAANGRIAGNKTELAVTATENLYGSAYITGRAFWTPTSTGFITYPYRETLTGTVNGASLLAYATAHGRSTLVPSLLAFQTDGHVRLCVVGGRCVTASQSSQVSLPPGMDGTWSMALDVSATGNRISGTAEITLSNSRALDYAVKGSYNPKRQISVLRLIGFEQTLGSSFVITVEGPNAQLLSLTGNVLGQRLRVRPNT